MIVGDYYRSGVNEAEKAAKLTWELIHAQPHVTTVN